jgi:OOP family OmpA-OmpF porin
MKGRLLSRISSVFYAVCVIALASPDFARGAQKSLPIKDMATQQQASHVNMGQKMDLEGVVLNRDAQSITVRNLSGANYVVKLTSSTEVKERKSNPFRRARNYDATSLLRGLNVEVEGRGDDSGDLVANQIRIRPDDLRLASTMESRMEPVEGLLAETEKRVAQSEQNAQRLSGQMQELESISNAARGGAKVAQQTADAANEAAKSAAAAASDAKAGVRATNERISSLDDFQVKETARVHFKAGSAILSKEEQAELDRLASVAQNDKGYIIEVSGFASTDGSTDFNRRLSQRRADAVIRYLAENYSLPLRRFVTPFGYGTKQPVADNRTREGRKENRRVEVKILVSKGLTQPESVSTAG